MGQNIVNSRAVKVRKNANQSINTATQTAIIFDTQVDFLPYAIWSSTTNPSRVTVNAPGLYLLVGNIVFAAAATGNRESSFRKNGTTGVYGQTRSVGAAGNTAPLVSVAVLSLKAGEYVELMCFQDSGGAVNVAFVAADEQPSLAVILLDRYYDASLGQEIGNI